MKTNSHRFQLFSNSPSDWFLIALAVVTIFLTPALGQKAQKAIDYYNSGLQKQENGDVDGALAD